MRAGQGIRYLGCVMCCAGIIIRLLALDELETQFSAYATLQDDHRLVQSGIYSYTRHPLYLSLLLAAPGFALVFDSWFVVPILLVAVIFICRRVRQEEVLLERHFEAAFCEYKNRTWALIPLVF